MQVLDPRELELPNVGRVCLEDPETRQQVIVNTSNPDVRQAYAERVIQMQDDLTMTFRRNNVERIGIRTDSDYLPALKSYFRSRKRR